jgi:hypothetical protein
MVKRKKRLAKGIESLQEQIELHLKKKEIAEEKGNLDLVGYYEKEIRAKEETKKRKEEMLKKQ